MVVKHNLGRKRVYGHMHELYKIGRRNLELDLKRYIKYGMNRHKCAGDTSLVYTRDDECTYTLGHRMSVLNQYKTDHYRWNDGRGPYEEDQE